MKAFNYMGYDFPMHSDDLYSKFIKYQNGRYQITREGSGGKTYLKSKQGDEFLVFSYMAPWKLQEQLLMELVEDEWNPLEIARELGRLPSSVLNQINYLARKNHKRSKTMNEEIKNTSDMDNMSLSITMQELVDATMEVNFYEIKPLTLVEGAKAKKITRTYKSFKNFKVGDTVAVPAGMALMVGKVVKAKLPQPTDYQNTTSYLWIIGKVNLEEYELNKQHELDIAKAINQEQRANARQSVLKQMVNGASLPKRKDTKLITGLTEDES